MTGSGLDRIAVAANALYLREIGRIRDILSTEADLLGRLAQLDAAVARSRADLTAETEMRRLGADILWQAWESRTRRNLNIDLAQVRARKLAALEQVRRAFGRQQAIRTLADSHAARRRIDAARLRENRLMDRAISAPD